MFLLFVKINRACLFPINEFGHKQTNKMSPEKRINWTIRLSLFKNNKKVHSEHSMQVFLWWVLRLDSIIDRINNNDNEESKKRQIYIWFYAKISMEIVSLLFFFSTFSNSKYIILVRKYLFQVFSFACFI